MKTSLFAFRAMLFNKLALMVFASILIGSVKLSAQSSGSISAEVLTNNSIIQMKTAGFSANIILSKISATNCSFTTDVNSLIQLKNANVDDAVIDAMIKKGSQPPAQVPDQNPTQPSPSSNMPPVSNIPPASNPLPVPNNQPSSNVPPNRWGAMLGKDTYITRKGIIYTVGQKIIIGSAAGQNDQFKYIIEFNMLNTPQYQKHATSSLANKEVTISKIIAVSGDPKVVYLIFRVSNFNLTRYGVNIEAGLASNEVVQ
jgi:hypothetical protein